MRRRSECLNGSRRLEFEGPERQIVPVAAKVTHGAVTVIPPAIPFRSRIVDIVKIAFGQGRATGPSQGLWEQSLVYSAAP